MPRPQSVRDPDLYQRLAQVFRSAGFAGASLGDLAEATGLQRASLYHRFPGGKTQMAEAVLDHVATLYDWAVAPMVDADEPAAGVAEAAGRLSELYAGGSAPCVLDSLTLSGAPEGVMAKAARVAQLWIDAMAGAARRAGRPDDAADASARDAFARIEGALVHARLFGERSVFERALAQLPELLVGAGAGAATA